MPLTAGVAYQGSVAGMEAFSRIVCDLLPYESGSSMKLLASVARILAAHETLFNFSGGICFVEGDIGS